MNPALYSRTYVTPTAMIGSPSARGVALALIDAVLVERQTFDTVLAKVFAGSGRGSALEGRDRAFARLLAATVLRRLAEIDAVLAPCLDRALTPKAEAARNLLRLGAAQLLFLGTPAHAAVDATAALADGPRRGPYRGLVNAVLRRVAREGGDVLAGLDIRFLGPSDWLRQSWVEAYGEAVAAAMIAAHREEPPLDLTLKDPALATEWAASLEGLVLPTGGVRRLKHAGAVEALPGYAEGAWWVQDTAASLPARLLGRVEDQQVVDLCAAPGGKTAQLAAAGARVIALDRSQPRMERLRQNLERLRLAAETVVADAAEWRPPQPVPAVLLDAPCTATGTIRRHPDVALLKTPADRDRLNAVQDRLLAAAVEMLAPGGVLVYCVCSLEPEEGPERIAALLGAEPRLERVPVEAAEIGGLDDLVTAAGDLRTLPCHLQELGGLDGFYAARLRRCR